jgi:hypothetical protein
MRRLRAPADRVYTKKRPHEESVENMEMMLYEEGFWKRVSEVVKDVDPATNARVACGYAKSARLYFGQNSES